jgi:hypothetical protein
MNSRAESEMALPSLFISLGNHQIQNQLATSALKVYPLFLPLGSFLKIGKGIVRLLFPESVFFKLHLTM